MVFIEQHSSHAGKLRVIKDHAGEDTFGHHLNAGLCRNLAVHAHAITNSFANVLTKRMGHAPSSGTRGKAAWFQHNDLAIFPPGRIQQSQRNARCFTGARLSDQHCIGVLLKSCE